MSGKLGRSSQPARMASNARPSRRSPARRSAFTCGLASLKIFGESDASHSASASEISGVHAASTAASGVAKPMRDGRPAASRMVTPTSPSASPSHARSSPGGSSVGTGIGTAAADVTAAICCSMPASSATRGIRVLNSSRAKMSRTAWASIGCTSRSATETGSSTSRSRRLRLRLRRTSSRCSRRLLPTTPVTLSAFSSRASSEPNWPSHLTAVFSPTFGTPGRLSLVSPTSAAMSGYCSGGTPYRSRTAWVS